MIIINTTRKINDFKQWVFIIIEVDGDTVEHVTVQPWNTNGLLLSDNDLLDWCNSQEERYKLEILKDMYPGAKPESETLQGFEQWVLAGAENPAENGKSKVKIQKKVWVKKHPKKIKFVKDMANADFEESKIILIGLLG